MTALPEITPHDEHKAKLIANVHPADWVYPNQPCTPSAHGSPIAGSSCFDTPSPGGGGSCC